MADTFGALEIPPAAGSEPAGDPALGHLTAFVAAVLNADAQAAWSAVFPRPDDARLAAVVRRAFTQDQLLGGWTEDDLPAIFVWRERGRQQDATQGYRTETATFRLLWVFPKDEQLRHVERAGMPRALMATLGAAIYQQRHPAWVAEADAAGTEGADPKAPTLAADDDAIALARPTQTSPLSLSGASLDGEVGGDTLSPRRGLTITTTAATGAYSTAAPIVVTFLDWTGREQTATVVLTDADGGETIASTFEVASVVSVAIPAQLATTGTVAVGLQTRAGRGSQLLERAGFMRLTLDEWQPTTVRVEVLDDDAEQRVARVITYHAVQATISATERHTVDPMVRASPMATAPAGLDLDVVVDGLVVTRAELDGVPVVESDAVDPP